MKRKQQKIKLNYRVADWIPEAERQRHVNEAFDILFGEVLKAMQEKGKLQFLDTLNQR